MDWRIGVDSGFPDLLHRRSLFLLATFWLCGTLVLVGYGTVSVHLHEPVISLADAEIADRGNATAPVVVSRRALDGIRKVAFDGSWTVWEEAGRRKIVYIANLAAESVLVGSAAGSPGRQSLLGEFARLPVLFDAGPFGFSGDCERDQGPRTFALDLADTTEVHIQQMDWHICRDDRIIFGLRCSQTVLRAQMPEILVLGDVAISTDDALLEARSAVMDFRRDRLIVTGGYRLTRHGGSRQGADGSFTADLCLQGATPRVANSLSVAPGRSSSMAENVLSLTADRPSARLEMPVMEGCDERILRSPAWPVPPEAYLVEAWRSHQTRRVRPEPFTGWQSWPQEAVPMRLCAAQPAQAGPVLHRRATE